MVSLLMCSLYYLDTYKRQYIQKHTPEDNGDIESFHYSIKTDYIWPNDFRNFNDASIEIFYDYNECSHFILMNLGGRNDIDECGLIVL